MEVTCNCIVDAVNRYGPDTSLLYLNFIETGIVLGNSINSKNKYHVLLWSNLLGDIVGYTSLSSTLKPEDVFTFLNSLYLFGGCFSFLNFQSGFCFKFFFHFLLPTPLLSL